MPFDGRARPTLVAWGSSRRRAPTGVGSSTPLPVAPAGRPGCFNVVVVRDVRTGEERAWRYPDDPDHPGGLYQEAWRGARLVRESYEGCSWLPSSTAA